MLHIVAAITVSEQFMHTLLLYSVPDLTICLFIIIIIINEMINVAFSRRTARTRNSHKKHKPRKRHV